MFLASRLKQANDELSAFSHVDAPFGKWCMQRGIKLSQIVLTNSKKQVSKVVLYATMNDIQITEYALRF